MSGVHIGVKSCLNGLSTITSMDMFYVIAGMFMRFLWQKSLIPDFCLRYKDYLQMRVYQEKLSRILKLPDHSSESLNKTDANELAVEPGVMTSDSWTESRTIVEVKNERRG